VEDLVVHLPSSVAEGMVKLDDEEPPLLTPLKRMIKAFT